MATAPSVVSAITRCAATEVPSDDGRARAPRIGSSTGRVGRTVIALPLEPSSRRRRPRRRPVVVAVGLERRGRVPDAGDAAVLDVVLHLVVADQRERAVAQCQQERGQREGDHDGGERERLGQRVGERLRRGVADDRHARGRAADELQQQVRAVAEHDHAEQHPHQRPLQHQVEADGVEHADGQRHDEVDGRCRHEVPGGHVGSPAPRMSRSMPEPSARSRSSTTPTISRYTPTSRNRLVTISSSPSRGQRDDQLRAGEHRGAEQDRGQRGQHGDGQPDPHQHRRPDRDDRARVRRAAREVAQHEGQARDEPGREPAAGTVVADAQQVDREDEDRREQRPRRDLEHQGAPARVAAAARQQPGRARAVPRLERGRLGSRSGPRARPPRRRGCCAADSSLVSSRIAPGGPPLGTG